MHHCILLAFRVFCVICNVADAVSLMPLSTCITNPSVGVNASFVAHDSSPNKSSSAAITTVSPSARFLPWNWNTKPCAQEDSAITSPTLSVKILFIGIVISLILNP